MFVQIYRQKMMDGFNKDEYKKALEKIDETPELNEGITKKYILLNKAQDETLVVLFWESEEAMLKTSKLYSKHPVIVDYMQYINGLGFDFTHYELIDEWQKTKR